MEFILNHTEKFLGFTLFSINQTPITILSLVLFVLVLTISFFITKFFNFFILRRLLLRFGVDQGVRFTLQRINFYLMMSIGTIIAFQFIGIDLSGLAVIFGMLSVGIGFGLQNVTSNFVSGLILLLERPIKIGDRVMVGQTEGDVLDINIRSTTIRSLDNVSIIVPNSDFISSKVVNWSYGDTRVRINIEVGVSYDSDLDLVLNTLLEIAKAHPQVLSTPEPDVLFDSFGDSAWNLRLRVWLASPKDHHKVRSDLNIAIVRKFRERAIEIPFPQQDIHLRSMPSVTGFGRSVGV